MQNKMLEKGLIFFVRPSNIFVRITYMVSVLVFFWSQCSKLLA